MYHEIFTFTYVCSSGLPYFMNKEFVYLKVLWFVHVRYVIHVSFKEIHIFSVLHCLFRFTLFNTVLILHLKGKFSFSSLLKCRNKTSESCVVITAQNETCLDLRLSQAWL
jgi:hypothetical protein